MRTEEQEQEQSQTQTAPRTFYELLGISSQGSPDDVRAAYRRMALMYHPDVSPPGAAAENTRRFIQVQEAYETLSDPSRRASYDRALARGVCRIGFSGRRSQSYPAYYHHHHHQVWITDLLTCCLVGTRCFFLFMAFALSWLHCVLIRLVEMYLT